MIDIYMYIFTQYPRRRQDMTQGQFLSKIQLATRVKILNETVCVSLRAHALGEGTNQSVLSPLPAMST